jgi:hypothetical protein
MVVILVHDTATPLARWKLLSLNHKGAVALPRAYVGPLSTGIDLFCLPNLWLPPTITPIYSPSP